MSHLQNSFESNVLNVHHAVSMAYRVTNQGVRIRPMNARGAMKFSLIVVIVQTVNRKEIMTQETWHVRPEYSKDNVYRIWDANDNYHDDTSPEMMDKRAAVMQAAPEMLEALKRIIQYPSATMGMNHADLIFAVAVIAKAEGR